MVSDIKISDMIPESLFRKSKINDSPPQALAPEIEVEVEGSDAEEEIREKDILGAEVEAGNLFNRLAESNAEVERLRGTCWLTFFAMSSAVWDASTVSAISVTVTSTALGCASAGVAATRCICSRTLTRVSALLISSS
jgi:hypothetical protein